MPLSDWLPSKKFLTAEAQGVLSEGAQQLLLGRKLKHRLIDTVLLAAVPLLLPAVGGLVMSMPRMLSQSAEARKMMRDGVKELQERLLQKLKNDVHLHIELHASGDEAERNTKERAARVFLRAFDAAVVTKLQHAQTEREALVAWNATFKCLEDKEPCEALSEKEGADLRLAYGKLEPDVQKIVRAAVAHVRRDYRSLLRRAAALAAALATLAVCYAIAPQDWDRKSPGEILADQALADGKTPSEVQAAQDKWSHDLEALRAANNKEREEAGIRERKLAEEVRAAKAKDREASASNLKALQTSTANQKDQVAALSEKLERLLAAEKTGRPPTAMESATLLQSLMPNSMIGAISMVLMLGSLATMGLVASRRSRAKAAAATLQPIVAAAQHTHSVLNEDAGPFVLPPLPILPAQVPDAAWSAASDEANLRLQQTQESVAAVHAQAKKFANEQEALRKVAADGRAAEINAQHENAATRLQRSFRRIMTAKKAKKEKAGEQSLAAHGSASSSDSPPRGRSAERSGAPSRSRSPSWHSVSSSDSPPRGRSAERSGAPSRSRSSSVESLDDAALSKLPLPELGKYTERYTRKVLKAVEAAKAS